MVAYTTVVRLLFKYAPQAYSAVRTMQEAAALWRDNKQELQAMSEAEADDAIRRYCQDTL